MYFESDQKIYTYIMVYSTIEHNGVEDETLSRKVTVIWNFYQFQYKNVCKNAVRHFSIFFHNCTTPIVPHRFLGSVDTINQLYR